MYSDTGLLTIDLNALRKNYTLLHRQSAECCVTAAAVKADAYGLGALKVTNALLKEGCRDFFVANLQEGLELRAHFPDIHIYVLGGVYPQDLETFTAHNLIPVIHTLETLEFYKGPAILHFDTAMNRLGLTKTEGRHLIENPSLLDHIDLRFIMSHLASSEEPENPSNAAQLKCFQNITSHFKGVRASLCNSAGIYLGGDYHFDLTRPGIALYGGNPTPSKPNPMHSVVKLEVPIVKIFTGKDGKSIGYNGTYTFNKDTALATLHAGYADGLFRTLSNKGAAYIGGVRCPILGRISMDLVSVGISALETLPKAGDMAELLGPHQSIDDLAHDANTISYEIITSLGPRYTRTYTEN